MKHTIPLIGALAVMAVSLQPANAASTITRIDATNYDLTTPKGVDAAHRDIVAAAARVCRVEFRGWEYHSAKRRAVERCVSLTTDDAVLGSGQSALVAFHKSLNKAERYDVARAQPTAAHEMTMAAADQ